MRGEIKRDRERDDGCQHETRSVPVLVVGFAMCTVKSIADRPVYVHDHRPGLR